MKIRINLEYNVGQWCATADHPEREECGRAQCRFRWLAIVLALWRLKKCPPGPLHGATERVEWMKRILMNNRKGMRKYFAIVLLCLCASLASAVVKTNVVLAWDYPANELSTNMVFRIYSTNVWTPPTTNWPVLTNLVGTNLSVILPIQPGNRFFVMTAINTNYDWGESDFSNVAEALVPRRGSNLTIRPYP